MSSQITARIAHEQLFRCAQDIRPQHLEVAARVADRLTPKSRTMRRCMEASLSLLDALNPPALPPSRAVKTNNPPPGQHLYPRQPGGWFDP